MTNRPRYSYEAADGSGETCILKLPSIHYKPPEELRVPLVPSAGSGYELYVNPTPLTTPDEETPTP